MSITKPYRRLWRPVKGYDLGNEWIYDIPQPSIEYLEDERYVCQSEINSLVTTAHLIIRDLYALFNYIEPHDSNLGVFSHRLYELFLRTATEFESNCKAILRDTGYAKNERDMNITDYFKIGSVARLSEYRVSFVRWNSSREFKPFEAWNSNTYTSLQWYQSYNNVKHNRFTNFTEASLDNLMNAISGLLCILHAQYGENMVGACFEGLSTVQSSQDKVKTGTFIIKAPIFPDDEQYDFIWDDIKGQANPVENYSFR